MGVVFLRNILSRRISITIRRPSFNVRHLAGYVEFGFFNEVRIPGEKSSDATELAKSVNDPAWIKSHPIEEATAARSKTCPNFLRSS